MNSNPKLKIALIAPPLSGHKYRGTGTYTKELYQALLKIREIEVKLIDIKDTINDFDLIHFPYFDPFFLTLPFVRVKPTVVTVHDLIPLRFPKYFPPGIKGRFKWQIQKFSLRNASGIITDSYASKEDIVRFTRITPAKINVIYLGVDDEFGIIHDKGKLEKMRQNLCLPKEFILHVGEVNYNKNILGLIKAFRLLNKSHKELNLVLVGNGFIKDSRELQDVTALIKESGLEKKIHRLGYIDKTDMIGIYNLAKVYVQVSFAEGFGLPVVDAMACGIPVVVSNSTSLPEIVGEAGLLVDPNNVKQISGSISILYSNKKMKEELSEKGLERIKFFTWDKCAVQSLAVYQKAMRI